MADQNKTDERPKDLINDAEFVALVEAEMREGAAEDPTDERAQERLWQRLNAHTATPPPRRPLWPWALVAAVALGLIPLLMPRHETDLVKGGNETAGEGRGSLSYTSEDNAYTIRYSGPDQGFLALVEDSEPFDVLRLGNTGSNSWTIPKADIQTSRVCAITGQDIGAITRKLNLIRELKQLPEDAPCLVFPPTSE